MSKYFILNEGMEALSQTPHELEQERIESFKKRESRKTQLTELVKKEIPPLKNVEGKVIVQVDLQGKNWHTFEDGTKIRLERQFENLNRRETEPVNAIVVSAENIPIGSEILIHPNAPSDTNKIHNIKNVSNKLEETDISYYSIPDDQCFIWRDKNNVWQPIYPYETALRVFKPYTGIVEWILPTMLKDTLYVTSGEYKGLVVATIKASDYCVVFQDTNGRENQIIRFRPNGDERTKREPEAIAILHHETELVNRGDLFVGISDKDAKPIQINAYAD